MSSEFSVILVDSTGHALRIEKLLVKRGLACKLIPVPRHLSSDCGVCVRVLTQQMEMINTVLAENQIEAQEIEEL